MSSRYTYTILFSLLVLFAGCALIFQVANKVARRAPHVVPLTPQEEIAPEPIVVPEPLKRSFLLYAVGDIMLSRTVADKMNRNGFAYPFSETSGILNEADAVFANLECPITEGRRVLAEELSFRADPGVELAMADANISAVSLANNHSPNFGNDGLLETITYLQDAGIASTGAGENLSAALKPAILERNGISLGILAFTWSSLVPASYGAADSRPGTAFMDIERMQAAVRSTAEEVDFVIVSMHSGIEYTYTPTQQQQDFARAAIDAGAELVIGHHPHVVQNIEKYKDKYILYSLGNFIFDQMWSQPTREGMIAALTIDEEGVDHLEFMPVIIDDYSKPRLAGKFESGAVVSRLQLDAIECPCSVRTADAE